MPNSYDRIARLYDVDMGSRMAFDDVGFYEEICRRSGNTVLEVGCGNGRVLLPLARAGLEVFGVDASVEMLRSLKARAPDVPVAAMDIRRLAVRARFDVILCPYSLITYVHRIDEARRAVVELASLLRPGGRLVLDAFVPREPAFDARTFDYRVRFEDGFLERHKLIHRNGDGSNTLKRFYSIQDGQGGERARLETTETIRPYAPSSLRDFMEYADCHLEHMAYDYDSTATAARAQHATAVGIRAAAQGESRSMAPSVIYP